MATPLRSARHDCSSPLPSLDEILSKIKKPETDPLHGSPPKFTTASSFVRNENAPIDLTTPVQEPAEPIDPDEDVIVIKIPAPGQKRYRRKNGSGKLREWKPKPKKPAEETEDKPWRKYQSPESKAKGRTKAKKSHEPVLSRHFSEESRVSVDAPAKKPEEPLQLAPAARRRVEWTPPPADKVITIASASSAPACTPDVPAKGFDNLLENYGKTPEEKSLESRGQGDVLGKRKLIDTVSLGGKTAASADTSAKKAPKKKKKPRTITELATAAYVVDEPVEPQSSMLNYLEQQAEVQPRQPTKKTRKSAAKKKQQEPEPILLSPNAAIREASAQAYVFGTSSQLVLDELPVDATIDNTPAWKGDAYREEDPFATPINSDAIEPPPKRKLWEVAARDEDGRVLDLPVIDLVDTPDPDAMGLEINPFGYSAAIAPHKEAISVEARPVEAPPAEVEVPTPTPVEVARQGTSTSEVLHSPPNSEPTSNLQPIPVESQPPGPVKPKYDLYTDAQLAREVASYGFKSIKRRTAMLALLDQCWQSKTGTRTPLSPLPSNRSLSTTVASSAKAASPKKARGRPKKTADPSEPPSPKRPRGRPKKDAIVTVDPSEPPPSGQAAPSPKRPRGRPRKDATVTVPHTPTRRTNKAIEIPDSDSDGLDTIPSSPEEATFSSPPGIDMTLSLDAQTEGSLAVGTAGDQTSLMTCITKAVRAAPRTKDPSQPSWHEKMLMYEPVILEDLAAWLNTGPLDQAGYDGEVSPAEVKQWCESKSVCCLWRMNISGKERKRY